MIRSMPTIRVRAFTLMELMVVIGIIGILVAISVPALGPILASNHQSEVINTLNGVLTSAQTAAQANGTEVALRIERAYKTDKYGEMVDTNGKRPHDGGFQGPVWLPYQQIRYVIMGTTTVGVGVGFRTLPDSKLIKLPQGAWVAPDYATNSLYVPNTTGSSRFDPSYLVNDYRPGDDGYPDVVKYNAMETFYVVLSPQGAVSQFPASKLLYRDKTQLDSNGSPLYVPYPDPSPQKRLMSARGFIVYDRKRYEFTDPSKRLEFLVRDGRPVFINRFIASIVEGEVR